MGVKDLWQLLAPIGRRISIETLEGKILAIDASVWIVQFIKVFTIFFVYYLSITFLILLHNRCYVGF